MRHKIAGNRLNRKTSHRKATVRDIAKATLIRQRITTTKAKAKEARKLVDKLITLGKKGTLADKRRAYSILCDHKLVRELFNETSLRFKSRVGGYTRIIRIGTRRGDSAQLVYLELTEKSEVKISKPKSTAAAKREKVKPLPKPEPAAEKVEGKIAAKPSAKEQPSKKNAVKEQPKMGGVGDKAPKGGKFVSGLRKIFNKKSTGK